ncbi:TPA: hypothetical protein ACG5BG_002012 [Pseudomonas aeruginosa]|uniref:hypothetical protein n=1 Tax=Pseudomonas aeruginosa TaxID=287 RepID=UPI000940D96D|nr:hypothetical protein [Pseudomonas aeruginosa]ELK4902956.1 hypothetical protein [Pseudomonas aeruginosa]MBG6611687.1 hypothetical protein [Pseudomonas aeruginosa]RTV43586.1 hypothetical protein DY989_31740 [Pseudomonas aeruginosa]RTX31895.1 hypothetical protein DZA21_18855 [Pseudomonas aeruginosa]HEJ1304985.1 hypothetical protein [Pseudomonas aeruginosa]
MNTFKTMLSNWENKAHDTSKLVEITLTIRKQDLVKIKAFSEAYGLDQSIITEGLIHSAIKEAETAMPYVKGSEVIRVEEGEEVYADVGKTPAFVEAEIKIFKSMNTQQE